MNFTNMHVAIYSGYIIDYRHGVWPPLMSDLAAGMEATGKEEHTE